MEGRYALLLHDTQETLEAWLTHAEQSLTDHLSSHLFEAGRAAGLSDKEVTMALVKPVKDHLRHGLGRA